MNEDTEESEGFLRRAWRWLQWAVAIILGLCALLLAIGVQPKLHAPGAPMAFFWGATALFAVIVLALFPPAFFRLPRWGKIGTYAAILPAFVVLGTALSGVTEAYERTPEGARVAEQQRKQEAVEALEAAKRRETENKLAELRAFNEQLKEIVEQQEACLSWGGELSDLNEMVKQSLHNPSSFEHVETRFIVPEEDRMNVVLFFRAENGFGAVRTAAVKAQMIPESCEIVKVGELEQA